MVKVYHAKFRDAASGEMRVSPYKGTVEWASRLHGVIIPDSAEDVAERDIGSQGQYVLSPIGLTEGAASADVISLGARRFR